MSYGIYPAGVVEPVIEEHISTLGIVTTQTVYINPTFSINGDGTTWTEAATPGAPGAFNAYGIGSWTSGAIDLTHFWRSGTRYLQAAETTYNSTVVVYACVGCIFGTYDTSSGKQIKDATRRAKVHPATGNAFTLGGFSATRRLFLFDNLDLRALNRTVSGNYPITGFADRDYRVDVSIVRCILDGYTCSSFTGAGITFIGNGFYGYGDGIGASTTLARAEFNTKLNDPALPIYPAEYDTCAFQARDPFTVESYIIRNNDLRLEVGVTTVKQIAYFYNANADGSAATLNPNNPTGTMLIANNLMRGSGQPILVMYNGVSVLNNIIESAGAFGINMWGSRSRIEGNYITGNNDITLGINVNSVPAAPGGTSTVRNNLCVNVAKGVADVNTTNARTLVLENNIIRRINQSSQGNTSMRLINTISGCVLLAANNTFTYNQADAAELFYINGVKTWAQYISNYDPNGLNTDPELSEFGAPASITSPSYHSGKELPYVSVALNGILRWIPPSRGAAEFVNEREP